MRPAPMSMAYLAERPLRGSILAEMEEGKSRWIPVGTTALEEGGMLMLIVLERS